MPRVIFKCPHIKGGTEQAASHLKNYVEYMSTRKGVDEIDPSEAVLPATKEQRRLTAQILRDFPLSRGMFEYEDYRTSPTRGNASEFIARALEENYDRKEKRENYIKYIAMRPNAQRVGSHGLFTGSDDHIVLSQVADEVAHHPGVVWLPTDDVHALVTAASGAGKTAFFLYPNIEYALATGMSFLCTDTAM